MANTADFTNVMKDMMGNFPMDMKPMEDMFKSATAFNEKLTGVALEAAGNSAEISNKWTKDTLDKLTAVSKAKEDPADYAKAFGEFASAYAEASAEHLAAYAEVAKKAQKDTVELVMAAGKDLTDEANAAVKKATSEVATATKKAAK
ncbi:MAG: phasin family protein [Rhodobacteraceae bacterium]|nr:phasin family protein [Paracoccaceae bacterium]